ncbi:ATP synthase F1 subunit delta [Alienimonas californiensis]|uniref:ATP synthase subunit delta n=1 Tax=Alienimonas californiensis TaxID=2527989 RepID=A0A517PBH8_9PLAN|nr:ATP synthase F1 subunit delta [Alienimonas californiensis]QDT16720.1 ATP synthase subunit delta, sodium ion specific [Alienimonas californiensis]
MIDDTTAELAQAARTHSVMEDPSSTAIARTYADAFLRASGAPASEEGVDGVLEEFTSFQDDVLTPNPEFERMLLGASTSTDEKLGLIERVVVPRASQTFANFLRVLARHGRLELLPQILGEAHVAREAELGKQRVIVTTARPLSAEDLAGVESALAAATSYTPVVIPEVDPAILGGMVIRVGDTVYDSSLKARLRQLRGRLKAKATHEIQSGRDRLRHSEGD